MIEKLESKMECIGITIWGHQEECLGFDSAKKIVNKINELIDAVNGILDYAPLEMAMKAEPKPAENVLTMVDNQVTANLPNIDAGELAFLSKENSELKDEIDILETKLERTRKALEIAKDTFNWIDETYRTGQETEAEIWGKVQLAAQEITALEQKDK